MTIVTDVTTVTFPRVFRHLTFSTGNRWLLQSIYCSYNKTCSVLLYRILFVNPVFKPELKILHTLGSHLFEHKNSFFHKYITYWKSLNYSYFSYNILKVFLIIFREKNR